MKVIKDVEGPLLRRLNYPMTYPWLSKFGLVEDFSFVVNHLKFINSKDLQFELFMN